MNKEDKKIEATMGDRMYEGAGNAGQYYTSAFNPQQTWTTGTNTTGGGTGGTTFQYPQPIPNQTFGYQLNPNEAVEQKLDQLIAVMLEMTKQLQRLDELVALLES